MNLVTPSAPSKFVYNLEQNPKTYAKLKPFCEKNSVGWFLSLMNTILGMVLK